MIEKVHIPGGAQVFKLFILEWHDLCTTTVTTLARGVYMVQYDMNKLRNFLQNYGSNMYILVMTLGNIERYIYAHH